MQNYANYWELDPGQTSNQIGKHKKPSTVARVHAKFGQLCERDPGHISNQIGQQQQFPWKICLQNLATFICGILRNYCYEISFF
jgi:hypothetical protein